MKDQEPQLLREEIASFSAASFLQALREVAFAAARYNSKDVNNPALKGLLLDFRGERLILVAADGYRLSKTEIPLSTPNPLRRKILVPPRALEESCQSLFYSREHREGSLELKLRPDTREVVVINPQTRAGALHSELETFVPFPNYYERLVCIPPQSDGVIFERKKVLEILNSFDRRRPVRIKSSAVSELYLWQTPAEDSQPTREEKVGVLGQLDSEICLTYSYLHQFLRAVTASRLKLEVGSPYPYEPCCFRKVDAEDGFVHLIMPRRV